MRRYLFYVALTLLACGVVTAPPHPTPVNRVPTPAGVPTQCAYRYEQSEVLPDPSCTTGAVSDKVSTANLSTTICTPGYTKTVRPPVTYTDPLKARLMRAYGGADQPSADFELDHLIALEIGGDPVAVANLWPQPRPSANHKDAVEGAAHQAVCSGRMNLADAQQAMAQDWVNLGKKLGVL